MSGEYKAVVGAVLAELSSRKGFDWWWHDIDAEIQEEIEDACAARVAEVLGSSHATETPTDAC